MKLHEIHFPVWLGGLKWVNVTGENSNTSDFDKIKIISLSGSVYIFDY